jgi:uncharacterized protein YabN with tetrapyrrole methylase and pyrophosphatase domain
MHEAQGSRAAYAPEVAGRLTIVGTGITLAVHVTPEARAAIARADEVLYLLAEPAAAVWIEGLPPGARSLETLYELGGDRRAIYARIVDEVAAAVARGGEVCLALYGHPGVFAYPSHELLRRAREEGWEARMLPAVSAEGCLFADLGVDPGLIGCLSFEATDFLVHRRRPDTAAGLVLWQIGVIGTASAGSTPRSAKRQSSAEIPGSIVASSPSARACRTASCGGREKTPGWP